MKKTLGFLLLLNICFLILAFIIKIPLPFYEWRKGPPIHIFSAYSSGNAEIIFWIATAFFVDLYFFIAFLINYFIKKRRILLSQWTNWIIITAAFITCFLFVEYGTRLYIKNSSWYTQFRSHPLLYWYNRSNLWNFTDRSDSMPRSTNSCGFRYREEINSNKLPGEYRIFVFGDSSAFGHGVYDNESFSAQLEKKLNDQYGKYKFRVINTACPGHTTYQGLIILKYMVLSLRPDMIIVAYNNDPALEYLEEKQRTFTNPFVKSFNNILYRSDYCLLFQRTVADFKMFILSKFKKIKLPMLVRRVSLADYQKNLEEFIHIAKEHNIQIMFIKMPVNLYVFQVSPDLKELFYDESYQDALVDICHKTNHILIDVDAEWSKKDKRDLFQSLNYNGQKKYAHFHPNAQGHREIAEQIYAVIIQNNLVR